MSEAGNEFKVTSVMDRPNSISQSSIRVFCRLRSLGGLTIYGMVLCLLVCAGTVAPASPFALWHPRSPMPTRATLYAVTYGNERFVAVGTSGTIVASTNGLDWALGASGVSRDLKTITFANGRFVAGGSSGVVLWSDDGEVWSRASVPIANNVDVIGFGIETNFPNGLFVALASTNQIGLRAASTILTSADGITWQTNAHFYSGGYSSGPSEGPYSSIAFGKQRCVVSGDWTFSNPSIPAITSASGTNWTYALGTPVGPVAFGANIFVIAAYFQQTSNGLVLLTANSSDGYVWPGQGYSGSGYFPFAACFGGGQFIVVGQQGAVAVSPDGTNWITGLVGTDADLQAVAYGAGLYVAIGTRGLIMSSPDGVTWTQRSDGPSRHLSSVAADQDGFIAVGSAGTLALSTNGSFWDTIPTATSNYLRAVRVAGGKYVAAGASGTILSGDTFTSLSVVPPLTAASLGGLAYGNGTFIAVGDAGVILSSSDAVNWSLQNSATTNTLASVTFGAGQFVAAGANGSIVTSSDANGWVTQNAPTTRRLVRVAYGAGRFVAVASQFGGTGPYIISSQDGVTWESEIGASGGATAIAYGNGFFVVSSAVFPAVYISPDGRNWTQVLTTGLSTPSDLAYNNGTFVEVGLYGAISQSDPVIRLGIQYDGTTSVHVEGPKNGTYRIEALDQFSGNLEWQLMTTLSGVPNIWTDPQSGGLSNRFYRASLIP